jgi:hypothetical protein
MNKVCTKIQQNMSVIGNIGKIFGKKEFHPALAPQSLSDLWHSSRGEPSLFHHRAYTLCWDISPFQGLTVCVGDAHIGRLYEYVKDFSNRI